MQSLQEVGCQLLRDVFADKLRKLSMMNTSVCYKGSDPETAVRETLRTRFSDDPAYKFSDVTGAHAKNHVIGL